MRLLAEHLSKPGGNCSASSNNSAICINGAASFKKQNSFNAKKIKDLEAMVTRSLFGNINASRNSA